MRAFARKQKQNQARSPTSSTFARANTPTPGPTHRTDPILSSQRATGSDAGRQALRPDAEGLEIGLTAAASTRFEHDFSQSPIRPPAARAIEAKPSHGEQDDSGQMPSARSAVQVAPGLRFDLSRIPIAAPPIQRKPTVSSPDDPLEREADDVADTVMRMPEPAFADSIPPAMQHGCAACADEGTNPIQTKPVSSANTQGAPDAGAVVRATERAGAPLPKEVRSHFERSFGHDFSGVRVHADGVAANAARTVQARAYTVGRNIVFGAGQHAPSTREGKRLLAHELVHIVQQRRGRRLGVMRQPVAVKPAPRVRPATVEEAAEFLEDMAAFINGARSFALGIMQPTRGKPATPADRQRAHRVLNQQRLRDFLANARTTFAVQEPALQAGDPHGTRLRKALLEVVAKVREAAPDALGISDGMAAPTPDDERRLNAELIAQLIEVDPFTSAGLVGTPAFGAAETGLGAAHQAFIEGYLDDLIRTLPGRTLAPADRDRILGRISAGLRRAFLTVGTGPAGTPDVRAITNPTIVEKYRRVIELLSARMSAPPLQLSIITDSPPAFVLPPDPVPDVTAQLHASPNVGSVDLSRVPGTELPYVRYGVLQAVSTVFGAGSTVRLRSASWPVAFPVRRGGNLVQVRYDLIFDAAGNVRVERLGEAVAREVTPAFAQLALPAKKAQLIADFALAAVDDRPAAPGRPAAAWTGPELDQVKAAYDLIPAGDRPALRGVTIVRDHHGPPLAHGQTLGGLAHTGPDPGHDAPVPPPHGPPHIHYYDDAFDQNARTAVGAPGSTGAGADWTIAHEVGHMRIFLATRDANAAVAAANRQIVQANLGVPAVNAALPVALHQIRQAWGNARTAAGNAIQALNAAVIATPPAGPAQRVQLLQAAQAAVQARNLARANLAASAVPPAMIRAATNLDAAADALLAATQSLGVAQEQIPTFVALAGTFGFTPFTDYARREGNDEWFAETYALHLTDPNRLSQMNRRIFLWFEAGMPMNRAWRPAP